MKIATSLVLGVSLFGTAFGLRGSSQHAKVELEATRELQAAEPQAAEDAYVAEAADVTEAVAWTVDRFALFSEEARHKGSSGDKVRAMKAELLMGIVGLVTNAQWCSLLCFLGQGQGQGQKKQY